MANARLSILYLERCKMQDNIIGKMKIVSHLMSLFSEVMHLENNKNNCPKPLPN